MKKKTIIGIIIIVIFSLFAFSAFDSAVTPYVTFQEAFETSRKVQVMGYLEEGQANYNLEDQNLEFNLVDDEGTRALVIYNGVKPSNFDDADSIVVIGEYNSSAGVFQAEDLLVKCPSKYEGG